MTAVALFLLSMCLTWPISRLLSVVSALFIVFLSFVCPLWFMHVQEYKKYVLVRKPYLLALLLRVCGSDQLLACLCSEILGPWDIAHIQPEQ